MANRPGERRSIFQEDTSDLTDITPAISQASSSPTLPHQRHSYHQMDSMDSSDIPYSNDDPVPRYSSPATPIPSISTFEPDSRGVQGLGITRSQSTLKHVSSVSKSSLSPSFSPNPFADGSGSDPSSQNNTPRSTNPLVSPAWRDNDEIRSIGGVSMEEQDSSRSRALGDGWGYGHESRNRSENFDTPRGGMTPTINDNDNNGLLRVGCPAKRDLHQPRRTWLSVTIMILSIYSTLLSGLWLALAAIQPRYGRFIHSGGSFAPQTASIIYALGAKTIELSFVTVFVTFLGQVLSRRSLVKASRGITISELTMRTWVLQPGFMLTHFQNLQKAGMTILGTISLIAAIIAMLYTTASDALVSPHLKFGKTEHKVMEGLVKSTYGNPAYIADTCKTPISATLDPLYSGTTCLSYEYAGQAYHNSIAYLDTWAAINSGGKGVSTSMVDRPEPPAMLFDNTTVTGSWVLTNTSDMASANTTWNRIINNVTMSMPHAGIFSAARDEKNGILQPEELAGVGEYSIEASIVSPTINVMCVNMNATELAPLVYTTWPNAQTNESTIPGQKLPIPNYETSYYVEPSGYFNATVVDDIFGWGERYGSHPPTFGMYPMEYNSITNISVPFDPSNYLLIKANDSVTKDWTLCQLKSFLSPYCSTRYNVSGISQGNLQVECNDPNNAMAYDKSVSNSPISYNSDYKNVASQWITSMSLNTGVSNSNSSTSRLLAQLILAEPQLNNLMPSLGETLAAMAGSTLLLSSTDASFWHFWNYTAVTLDPGEYESFNATISSQQYTSGLTQKWQGLFYVVLALVYLTNLFCLIYFSLRSGLVTDYTEPQNLFALAVNSPPSERLNGSCGAGPEGHQLEVPWHVEGQGGHFFIKESGGGASSAMLGPQGTLPGDDGWELRRRGSHHLKSMTSYSKLSTKRASFL